MTESAHDIALLQRWIKYQDAEAYNEIVSRNTHMVYATCVRVLRNDSDATEVSQECFLKLMTGASQIKTSVSGWLHRLATHRSLNRLKSDARRREREIVYAESRPVQTADELSDLWVHVDEAIDNLPDKYRTILVDHFLLRCSRQEIAKKYSLSKRTVSYRIEEGVERVRKQLHQKGITKIEGTALASLATVIPLPSGLMESLGRLAVSGSAGGVPMGGTGVSGMTWAGGLLVMKSKLIVAGLMAVLILGLWQIRKNPPVNTPIPPVISLADPAEALPASEHELDSENDFAAEEISPVTEEDAAGVFTVSGRVYEKGTELPVGGTRIELTTMSDDPEEFKAVSDLDGNYAFANLAAGRYQLKRGNSPSFAQRPLDDSVVVDLTANAQIDFVLDKDLGIQGRVVTGDGQPISGATVNAGTQGENNNQSVTSDDDGYFALAGFSPVSELQLEAYKKGFSRIFMKNIQLAAPGIEDLDIVLDRAGGISGRAVDDSGNPLVKATVKAVHHFHYGAWLFDYPEDVTDEEGKFRIDGLGAGLYEMQVFPEFYTHYFSLNPAKISLKAGERRNDVELVLENGDDITIGGIVRDQEGNPVEGATVNAWGPRERSANTQADGRFTISGLVKGQYDTFYYKDGYERPNQDYLMHKIFENKTDFELVLVKQDLTVAGRVVSASTGTPIAQFSVSTMTDSSGVEAHNSFKYQGRNLYHPDGRFELKNVTTSKQKGFVVVSADGYAVGVQPFTVEEAESGDIVVELSEGITLQGTVRDQNGVPVVGARIMAGERAVRYAWSRISLTTTDENGAFTADNLMPNLSFFSATHPDYSHDTVDMKLAPDRINYADFRLAPAGSVAGVVKLNGKPFAFAKVMIKLEGNDDINTGTDHEGRFAFNNVPAGSYTIETWFSEGMTIIGRTSQQINVSGNTQTQVELDFGNTSSLRVTLYPPGLDVETAEVQLRRVSDLKTQRYDPIVELDETFRFDNVSPGVYTLTAQAIDSAKELFSRVMTVEIQECSELELTVDMLFGSQILGTVSVSGYKFVYLLNGLHEFDAVMSRSDLQIIYERSNNPYLIMSSDVTVDGTFVFKGLEQGSYTMVATRRDTDDRNVMHVLAGTVEITDDDSQVSASLDPR